MSIPIIRNQHTWLSYLLLAFYGYVLNSLGSLTPFLMEDLNLSYTVSSLHFTAFAAGILLVGLVGHLLIVPLGGRRSLWFGAFGISLGALMLLAGRTPVITISAAFLMGVIGSLILAVVPSVLSLQYGEQRAVALSEANVVASLASIFAPLMVGWFAAFTGTWRSVLALAVAFPVLLWLLLRKNVTKDFAPEIKSANPGRRSSLPWIYWDFWSMLLLAVAVEFCMVFWSANYMETGFGLEKTAAAQWVSLFLLGMILGRLAGSRLVGRFSAQRLVFASLLLASAGFLLYWLARSPLLGVAGLFLTGLGVANLYPMLLSLAIGSAGEAADQASARATLASGFAILSLPLLLGRLADGMGIQTAYGLVGVLLVVLLTVLSVTVGKMRTG
ncbi:MAG: MFS transporter [Chloroflexi bacterium]|nr:MAG: MFS transporter [Chloroflexota bacterium]